MGATHRRARIHLNLYLIVRAPPWFAIRARTERAGVESGAGFGGDGGVGWVGVADRERGRIAGVDQRSVCPVDLRGVVAPGVRDLYNGAVTSVPLVEENNASDTPASLLPAL
jgi:hypothetical protein